MWRRVSPFQGWDDLLDMSSQGVARALPWAIELLRLWRDARDTFAGL
jgi:hypothetical protein